MRWNKATRFALYAAVELTRAGGEPLTAQQIAERYGFSTHHLAKVLGQLVRAGVAAGSRGVGGGYWLARPPEQVTLLEVVEAVEGPRRRGCAVSDEAHDCEMVGPCALHDVFATIDRTVHDTLSSRTLVDAAATSNPAPRKKKRRRLPQV